MNHAIAILKKEKEKIIRQSFIDNEEQSKLFDINQALDVLEPKQVEPINADVEIISFVKSNSKMVTITLTELRNLICYATSYIEKSKPYYYKDHTLDFIRNNFHIMPSHKLRYKNLKSGSEYPPEF